ncbi:MAG: hypothetical protein ACE5NM_03165 [Sedimentisphaerales bacterium]
MALEISATVISSEPKASRDTQRSEEPRREIFLIDFSTSSRLAGTSVEMTYASYER